MKVAPFIGGKLRLCSLVAVCPLVASPDDGLHVADVADEIAVGWGHGCDAEFINKVKDAVIY
jgi:hypothetical protein